MKLDICCDKKDNILQRLKVTIILALIIVTLSCTLNIVYARISIASGDKIPISCIKEDAENNASVFPESYKGYIANLKEKHPNWVFKAVYLNVNWNFALSQESNNLVYGISTVPSSYPSDFKKDGINTFVDGSFVLASDSAVAYTLDPRNYLNETGIFQFMALSYSKEADTKEAVQNILSKTVMGTEEYKNKYYNGSEWITMDKTYAELIAQIGKEVGISSTHLASRIVQETAGDLLNNGSINGKNETYKGIFNFFNIGATPSANSKDSVTNGLSYASSKGWTTPYESIKAGAIALWENYIQYGQDTIYFEKFDVRGIDKSTVLFSAQYMTNILAPSSESRITYTSYAKSNMLDNTYVFYIPVYDNMPEALAPYPGSTVTEDSENGLDIVYLDDKSDSGVDDVFALREGPRRTI